MNKKLTAILFCQILFCFSAFGQGSERGMQKSEEVVVSFDQGSYAVDSKYRSNKEALTHLVELISQLQENPQTTITQIKIDSYTSPEGGKHYNAALSERRTDAIYSYLTENTSAPDDLIVKRSLGINWDGLRALVDESDISYKEEVIDILESVPEETWRKIDPSDKWLSLVDSRNKHLMDLRCGVPYREMFAQIYPQLRNGSVVTVYFQSFTPSLVETPVEIESRVAPMTLAPAYVAPVLASGAMDIRKPIRFAVKSNLLFDALLAPSIELEVPIGNKWSVAGEWIFPWWVTKNNGNALQILSGQLEGRYWFGERESMPQLTGWFAGLYAGGGLYDLQWKNNGYQGEFYIAAGLAGGYAHTINKSGSLRMEYSLGLGYLSTDYRYYEGMEDNKYLVWQHDGRYTWLGPTKAKVSLVWFIDWKRGGQR